MENLLFQIELGDYTIANLMSRLYDLIKGHKLRTELLHMSAVELIVEKLSERLNLEEMEVAMLSIVAAKQGGSLEKIAESMGMSWLEMADYRIHLESLAKKRYLYSSNNESPTRGYYLTQRATEAIMDNKPLVYVVPEGLKPEELAQYLMGVIDMYGNHHGENKLRQCWNELEEVLQKNNQVSFASYVIREKDDEEDAIVLLWMIVNSILHKMVIFEEHQMNMHLGRYDGLVRSFSVRSVLEYLKRLGILEDVCYSGLWDNESFRFSKQAADEIFADCENTKEMLTFAEENMAKSSQKIAKQELFYNETEERQVKRLTKLLEQTNFKKVTARLEKEGMRSGFTCLFYGAPGTGKTETVYQIAKKTGRDIVVVDVAEIKNKWVGESEQRMRSVFAKYRALVHNSKVTPILLFNEADAVIGKRKEGADDAVDRMENSIQNIILEEMESLKGIMIATTNLLANFDGAFERRFLYKIEFKKPGKEPMAKIWKSKMKSISVDEAQMLAEKYALSGGQIENICRKAKVEMILDEKDELRIEDLMEICGEEALNRKKSIGF